MMSIDDEKDFHERYPNRIILEPYDIYLVPLKEITTLEDMFLRSYSTESEHTKTVQTTIREKPACVPFAMDCLIVAGEAKSISFIQRHSIVYGISIIEDRISSITKKKRLMALSGTLRELRESYNLGTGLEFDTSIDLTKINVSMPMWCLEWIHTHSRFLKIPVGRFIVYLIIIALSRANISNEHISKDIKYESDFFLNYIERIDS